MYLDYNKNIQKNGSKKKKKKKKRRKEWMIRNTISTMDEPKVKSMLRKNNIRPHNDRKETFIKFKKG